MTKCEAIEILYGLVADVNAEEIADHIKTESLQDWSDTWRCRAKEMLMVLEDEPSNSEKPNNCDTCRHNKLEWYSEVCDGCSKAHSNYEPKDEPQTKQCDTCKHKGKYAYCRLCGRRNEDNYEPQADCNNG